MRLRLLLRDSLSRWRDEILAERAHWFFWVPVLIACGIGIYFCLPFAFHTPILLAGLLCSLALSWFYRLIDPWRSLSLALLAVFLGLNAAHLRMGLAYTSMLDRALSPVMVEGVVEERESRVDSLRLLLTDVRIERRNIDSPRRIRLTIRNSLLKEPLQVGQRLRILANLLPITEPSAPGAYDFRFQAYFEGIGANGIALRAPEKMAGAGQAAGMAERWRNTVADRVHGRISGNEGAIAVALMTGERGSIDEQTNEDMRKAGTAHVLSISGMHIGMVGGFIFFLLRTLMAFSPRLALRYPTKKIAAIASLVCVLAYTWLVGAPIPAQRAALMAGLVFVAVLLDRQALSMRSLALAAIFILLAFPESLFNPGFQLSFAAMLMLVAAYEWWRLNKKTQEKYTWQRRCLMYVAGIVVTSLIAGFATMPYGAWHFHRLQLLGVLGNLLAVPLTGFIVMPAAVLAYLLMPFGLDAPVLAVMGWGLEGVTGSAAWVASLPGADINLQRFSTVPLLLMTFGGLWLALWRGTVRHIGIAVIMLGILLIPFTIRQPVALVSAEGRVAIRGTDGHLHYQRPPRGLIARDWSRAHDNGASAKLWSAETSGISCDASGCVSRVWRIALPRQLAALADDCERAALVIAPDLRVRQSCKARVIDRKALQQNGSYAVYADGRLEHVRSGSPRPWQPYYKPPQQAAD